MHSSNAGLLLGRRFRIAHRRSSLLPLKRRSRSPLRLGRRLRFRRGELPLMQALQGPKRPSRGAERCLSRAIRSSAGSGNSFQSSRRRPRAFPSDGRRTPQLATSTAFPWRGPGLFRAFRPTKSRACCETSIQFRSCPCSRMVGVSVSRTRSGSSMALGVAPDLWPCARIRAHQPYRHPRRARLAGRCSDVHGLDAGARVSPASGGAKSLDSSHDAAVGFARGSQWLRQPDAQDHYELSRGGDCRVPTRPTSGRHRRDGLLQRRILCAAETVQRMAAPRLQERADRPYQQRVASPLPRRILQFLAIYRGQRRRGRFRG
jgi:hypothetical protein